MVEMESEGGCGGVGGSDGGDVCFAWFCRHCCRPSILFPPVVTVVCPSLCRCCWCCCYCCYCCVIVVSLCYSFSSQSRIQLKLKLEVSQKNICLPTKSRDIRRVVSHTSIPLPPHPSIPAWKNNTCSHAMWTSLTQHEINEYLNRNMTVWVSRCDVIRSYL